MTAEEFLAVRFDLPESGQWAELEAGVTVHLQPPDLDHGTTILNLSKRLAACTRRPDLGYPCFDLGIRLAQNPDTVRFPAVSYFGAGAPFAEVDKEVTDTVPCWVIELASSADRRRQMTARVADYLNRGVRLVWVIDPAAQSVEVRHAGQAPQLVSAEDRLTAAPLLSDFAVQVAELFVEPVWWRG